MPFEIITMLGSSILSGIMGLWAQGIKSKRIQQEMLLARADVQISAFDKARTYDNKGFQWTRRIIALTAVAMVVVYPKIVVLFDIPVLLVWTEMTGGFFPFIESREVLLDKSYIGVLITPLDTHLLSAIVGLYFGGSIVRR